MDIITGDGEFNYSVDWDNDGTYDESSVQGPVSHDYKEPGTYTIRIRGQFPHMLARYNNGTLTDSNLCGMKVLQWGDIQWKSMKRMFAWCGVVGPIFPDKEAPDLSHVTDMSGMFVGNSEHIPFNPSSDSSSWRQPQMFDHVRLFNQPLNHWDVSHVTDMSFMFHDASAFNQPLDSWDVSNVTNMTSMFHSASAFNQPLDSWNTSKVTDMSDMFINAQAFDQPLDSWDTSKVTDMSLMFAGAKAFNQPLDAWNTSNVKYMSDMFTGCNMNTKNYDVTLQGWAEQRPMEPRKLDAKGLTYCKAAKARQKLIDAGWTFHGDAKKCD